MISNSTGLVSIPFCKNCITYSTISFHELKVQTWLFLLKIWHNPPKKIVVLSTKNSCRPASSPKKVFELEVWNPISYMVFCVENSAPQHFSHTILTDPPGFSWGSSAIRRSASSDLSLGQSSSTNAWGFRVGLQPSALSLRFGPSSRWWWCGFGWLKFHGILEGDGTSTSKYPHWKCVSHEKKNTRKLL